MSVVFDPFFSEDFFISPYETYRRMRDDAPPVYYSQEYDFYALTRHDDVAAAFKDYETYSSAYGVDLGQVRKGEVTEHGSIIAMDPPAHRRMRSLLNKVFTPRAIEAQRAWSSNWSTSICRLSIRRDSTSCRISRRCSRSTS